MGKKYNVCKSHGCEDCNFGASYFLVTGLVNKICNPVSRMLFHQKNDTGSKIRDPIRIYVTNNEAPQSSLDDV